MEGKRLEKSKNFKRLAESRVNKILSSLNNLSKLSNRQNYEYSEHEVKQIIDTLRNEISNIEKQFKKSQTSKKFKFN